MRLLVRQKESKWAGTAEDAFFSSEIFDRNRILQKPEYEASGRANKSAFYVIGVDVGRKGDSSVATVLKVTPQAQGVAIKNVVNIETFYQMHFEEQAIELKKLYYKYEARCLVIDANGIGMGLMDYMVKSQVDPATGDIIPDFGVRNDKDNFYKQYRTDITEFDAIYAIKANAPLNTEAYSQLQSQMSSGRIKFLIDDRTAQNKLLSTTKGKSMTPEERSTYLHPYRLTSILKEELLNLREETEGINIILKRANRRIGKDKVSSLCYGLYYIKIEEEGKKKKKFSIADWTFFN